MIIKHWEGTTHIAVGGNIKFLYEDSAEEIKGNINQIINKEIYNNMKNSAIEKVMKTFSYIEIAKNLLKKGELDE